MGESVKFPLDPPPAPPLEVVHAHAGAYYPLNPFIVPRVRKGDATYPLGVIYDEMGRGPDPTKVGGTPEKAGV